MAEGRYKEGVDFEWVTAKGSNAKTRRFFTKAEKEAKKSSAAPKVVAKTAPKVGKPAKKAAPKQAPVAKSAMEGYRAGDVTTTKLDKTYSGRGDGRAERVRRSADAALTKASKATAPKAASKIPPGLSHMQWKMAMIQRGKTDWTTKESNDLYEEYKKQTAGVTPRRPGAALRGKGNK